MVISSLIEVQMKKRRKNIMAKELRTPKYRMRVVESDKVYDRKKEKKVELE